MAKITRRIRAGVIAAFFPCAQGRCKGLLAPFGDHFGLLSQGNKKNRQQRLEALVPVVWMGNTDRLFFRAFPGAEAGALSDPFFDQLFLLVGQTIALGWHGQIIVFRQQGVGVNGAFVWITGGEVATF